MIRIFDIQKYFWSGIFVILFCIAAPRDARAEMPTNNIPLAKVASIKTLRFMTKDIHATAQYPVFRDDTLVARYANWQLRLYAEKAYREFLKSAKDNVAAFQKIDHAVRAPLEFKLQPTLWNYQSSRVISVSFFVFSNLGGAHPFSFTQPFTFGIIGERPRQLVLGDLFNPKGNYRARIERDILAKLKKTGRATWVEDGSVKNLTTAQLNNFIVTRDSVWWLFPPYDMGPYASGPFEVPFTPAQIGAGFDQGWMHSGNIISKGK